jgi:ankyrin repeat protein
VLAAVREAAVEFWGGPDPFELNTRGSFGNTPIFTAITWGDLEAVALLLQAGAEVNYSGEDGESPLHHAIRMGQFEIARYLICHGANTDAKDLEGKTPRDCCWEGEWDGIFGGSSA